MTISVDAPPLRTDSTGTVRVGNSRITLDLIVSAFLHGETAESIAEGYPSVSLGDVYAAIGYYLRHKDEVDRYLEQRRQEAEQLRREIESQPGYKELRERLIARGRELGLRE